MSRITFTLPQWHNFCKAFGLDVSKSLGHIRSLNKGSKSSSMNNETIGMTAEKAMCIAFNIDENIEDERVNWPICDKLLGGDVIGDICRSNDILPHTHIGGENGKTDFLGVSNGENITISLKTLKRPDGKICPQGGQPTYNSFHEKWHPECPKPAEELSRAEANTGRWNWIKSNIGAFLNKMQKQLFCCDVLILIRNCDKTPKAELLENKNIDFTKLSIGFNRPIYNEPPHKKKIGELSEFSTNVFHTLPDGTKLTIGEFQFHFKSRKEVKFRFYKKFYY